VRTLHIIQGGVANGDKQWLERAASVGLQSRPTWVTPKSSKIGNQVVIYVGGYGFFATGQIQSTPKPRTDWHNRYGASVGSIKLIKPAISLAAIQRHIPSLKWANYPRSITTQAPEVANLIRGLVQKRRITGIPDLDDSSLASANIDELRKVAILSQRRFVTPRQRKIAFRARSTAIRLYALRRADGRCEGCGDAPFVTVEGATYLEVHHIERLADDGPDHPDKVIALCANCHRRAHHSRDKDAFNRSLRRKLKRL